jgi:hypothetical protein
MYHHAWLVTLDLSDPRAYTSLDGAILFLLENKKQPSSPTEVGYVLEL